MEEVALRSAPLQARGKQGKRVAREESEHEKKNEEKEEV